MFNPKSILELWRGKRSVGCDLGSSCLKVVELEAVDGRYRLLKNALVKMPDIIERQQRVQNVQVFLKEKGFGGNKNVAVNIEDRSLRIRRMDLPKMPDRDMKAAIKWNFREYIEGQIEDYLVNYSDIKAPTTGDKLPICAYGVSRDAVTGRQAFMKDVGVRVRAIEPDATALLAAFDYNIRCEVEKYYVILDLGYSTSNFLVVSRGSLMFSRLLSGLSGRSLVKRAVEDHGFDQQIAEIKVKEFLRGEGEIFADEHAELKSKIEDTVNQFISQMVVDIQRSIDAFCIMYKKEGVDRIYLCGGGICLPDLPGRISSGLGVETELFNPFMKIEEAETASKLSTAPLYAVAVGLAMPQ